MKKPLLIFDGACHFCCRWIQYWKRLTEPHINFAPYQDVSSEYPQIEKEQFKQSIILIDETGASYKAAHAVFKMLSRVKKKPWLLNLYYRLPGFKQVSEFAYQVVARFRPFFSLCTDLFWGKDVGPFSYSSAAWLFLRVMGLIYAIAFISLGTQILGLVGAEGILPVNLLLEAVETQMGLEKYLFFPTLLWVNTSDAFLLILCFGGAILSLLLAYGFAPVLLSFVVWFFYLSLTVAGGEFLTFQWDILLLETGFLTILLSSFHLSPKKASDLNYSIAIIWLFRLLLFKLMFLSGSVKLLSGDISWQNLTALLFHYETQPLPTVLGWYAHQLPVWFQKISVVLMFVIELIVPFFIFGPRRLRLIAASLFIFFQILIMLTGNYCFFNLLAIALCLFLIDDDFFKGARPFRGLAPLTEGVGRKKSGVWPQWVIRPFFILVLLVTMSQFTTLFRISIPFSQPLMIVRGILSPFYITNTYGLFSVMTQGRPEIEVEGSRDGTQWFPYKFKYKPDDLSQRPRFTLFHQPRLDWQLWFAALGRFQDNPWFFNFCSRLLQGSPEVLKLLEENPFEERPPRYVRASLYQYRFSNFKIKEKTGNWWQREYLGRYSPILPPIDKS